MSYSIYFCDPVTEETVVINEPHFMRGGTYCVGGTCRLWLNVTYNYARNYSPHNFSIRQLDGMTALDAIPILKRVINALGDETDDDYWKPVDGNAKRALIQLLTMAQMRPDTVIQVR